MSKEIQTLRKENEVLSKRQSLKRNKREKKYHPHSRKAIIIGKTENKLHQRYVNKQRGTFVNVVVVTGEARRYTMVWQMQTNPA